MTTTEMQTGMSLDDYLDQSDDNRFEIIDGEVIPTSPNALPHMRLSKRLFLLLLPFEGKGELLFETAYVVEARRNWVRGAIEPDLIYIMPGRVQDTQITESAGESIPLFVVPDLAVEVVSPNDRFSEIQRRIDTMLEHGVRVVWLVEPEHRQIRIYSSAPPTVLRENDTLAGGDILPGFSVTLAELFA